LQQNKPIGLFVSFIENTMLKLYYARPSLLSRPIWLALLEKQLPHQLIAVNLMENPLSPEFLSINPFGQIPVLVDGDLTLIESMAILDYLEATYPNPPLLPQDPRRIGQVRMAQLVGINKIVPTMVRLVAAPESDEHQYAHLEARQALDFLQNLLGNSSYFGGEQLTLAEISVGSFLYRLTDLGLPLSDYPALADWSDRLLARPAWQQIQLAPAEWENFKRHIRMLPQIWQRRKRQRLAKN
jgi:glutathione S-transferase